MAKRKQKHISRSHEITRGDVYSAEQVVTACDVLSAVLFDMLADMRNEGQLEGVGFASRLLADIGAFGGMFREMLDEASEPRIATDKSPVVQSELEKVFSGILEGALN